MTTSAAPDLLSHEDKRDLVLNVLYAAEKEGRQGVPTAELEAVLDWAWSARLDASMVDLALSGDVLLSVHQDSGEMQFQLSPKGDTSAQHIVAPYLAAMYPATCRHCGCTDQEPCPGGCAWVTYDPPTCSNCAPIGASLDAIAGEGLISRRPEPVDPPMAFGKGRKST